MTRRPPGCTSSAALCHSIEKARRRLGYEPHYSSLAAVQEVVAALIDTGEVNAPPAP
jgi:nucleoside-diphosphate-sugar epimerase